VPAVLVLALAGCASSQLSTHPAAATAHPAAQASPPSMQLAAETSVGTGPLAQRWAAAILAALRAPAGNAVDVTSMIAWFTAEDDGHPAGQRAYGAGGNNPLNLTAYSGDLPGVTGTEPSGAGPGHPGNLDFDTPAHGVAATAWVIMVKYPAIARALISGRGLLDNPAVAAALLEWSGHGYSSLR